MKFEVLYDHGPNKGQPIVLNSWEKAFAERMNSQVNTREMQNALGIEINMTTLTQVLKGVIEQKFYEIKPSDYVPVRVGEGAWSTNLLTFTAQPMAGDFETGIINTGASSSRLAQAEAGLDSLTIPVNTWAKEVNWSLPEIAFAQRANQWDVIAAKEQARKTNWDLGIQKIAFLGSTTGAVKGLLNQTGVTVNTSVITKAIKNMNASEFQAFVGSIISVYRTNSSFTSMPDRFYIPEQDYTGLGTSIDETYPLKSRLERLLEAFKLVTRNPNFQVLPLVYSSQTNNNLGKNRYVLLNYNEENIRMDIPFDYTTTIQGTVNGFQYANVGYGQFTGVQARRPATLMYFDWVGTIT